MARARALRRRRARLEAKQGAVIGRELAATGISARVALVDAAVDPSSPLFWRVFTDRVAARETIAPLRSEEAIRGIAMGVLRDDGHDLTGITLKVWWRPPVLVFKAVPAHELAVEAVAKAKERAPARFEQR